MEILREKDVILQQLLDAVARLSPEEQRALWNLMDHRGLIHQNPT